jgi:hypothetical protein
MECNEERIEEGVDLIAVQETGYKECDLWSLGKIEIFDVRHEYRGLGLGIRII